MVYDELLTTTKYLENFMLMDGIDADGGGGAGEWTEGLETTTLGGPTEQSRVLGLYDIFIPMLGVFIIVLNLAVVISSGLILKKGKYRTEGTGRNIRLHYFLCGGIHNWMGGFARYL